VDILRRNGFRTGRVKLPGLDWYFKLSDKQYFRYDGIVPSADLYTDKVLSSFNLPLDIYTRGEVSYGRHIPLESGNAKASLTFVVNMGDLDNRFNRGHESTHAVIWLGLESQFLRMLRRRGYNFDPFKRFSNEEDIAHVGGFMAIYKTGDYDLHARHHLGRHVHEELMRARR